MINKSLLDDIELRKMLILSVLLLIGFLVNLKVLYSVNQLPNRKRKRPGNVLIVHLNCVAILLALLSMVLLAKDGNLIDLTKPTICEIVTFLKRAVIGIFSLNVVAIVFERFQTFNCFNRGKLRTYKLIRIVWMVAITTSIPSAFMVEYKEFEVPDNLSISNVTLPKRRKCQAIPLLNSLEATIVYEILRFLVFHAAVVCYMIYAMHKIRASVSQLYILKPIPDKKTQRKVKTLRFLYIHFLSFIFIWLPYGILTMAERIISRTPVVKTLNTNSTLRNILGLLLYIYMVLNPLVYLWLMSDHQKRLSSRTKSTVSMQQKRVAQANPLCGEKVGESKNLGTIEDLEENVGVRACHGPVSMDISQITTFVPTPTSSSAASLQNAVCATTKTTSV